MMEIKTSSTHAHNPRYFGPDSGIRCLACNAPVAPDPAVGRTAASPSPNLAATLAAVTARGERCANCGHWTFEPPAVPSSGRPTAPGQCRNCSGRVVNADGEAMLIRIHGNRPMNARYLRPDVVQAFADLHGTTRQEAKNSLHGLIYGRRSDDVRPSDSAGTEER